MGLNKNRNAFYGIAFFSVAINKFISGNSMGEKIEYRSEYLWKKETVRENARL